jgi:hypothetical protein
MEASTGIQPQHAGQINGPPADQQAGGMAMGGTQGGPAPLSQGQQQPGGPLMSGAAAVNQPAQGGGAEQACSCSEHGTHTPTGSGQVPDNPGPSGPTGTNSGAMGSPGMNPVFTGATGMNPGQSGSQGAWNPGNPPYSSGTMGNPGPSAGPFSQPGQAPWPFPGAGQMGPQSGGYPGQGPQPPFPPHYYPPYTSPAEPWSHPASGRQGLGPSTDPHMGHAAPGQGAGYMGAGAHHIYHDENRFGQMADMVGRLLKGEATPADMVNGLFSLNFRDDQFWKGALLGAVAILVFNSDAVHRGLGKVFGSKSSETEVTSAPAEKTTQKKSK